ncbi:MAG: dihydroneopterin aldolase [Turneriella sp.]|nr:dihydroneopterin aldolase [Turneriella sp.]
MLQLKICVERLRVFASVGIYPDEKKRKQLLWISAELDAPQADCTSDTMAASVDYDRICSEIRRVATLRHYQLIENLAYHIGVALQKLSASQKVCVRIDKPLAARKNRAQTIAVEVAIA